MMVTDRKTNCLGPNWLDGEERIEGAGVLNLDYRASRFQNAVQLARKMITTYLDGEDLHAA